MLWLEGCHNGVIRSAVVQGGLPDTAYADLVREIRDRGTSQKLENSFPMTQQGACSAIDFLRFYDLENLEILSSDPDFESPPLDEGVRVVHAKWVPPGCGVVVPADRSYLGMVGIFKGAYTLVVHNPTRGLAILGSW